MQGECAQPLSIASKSPRTERDTERNFTMLAHSPKAYHSQSMELMDEFKGRIKSSHAGVEANSAKLCEGALSVRAWKGELCMWG